MDSAGRTQLEARVRALCAAGDIDAALTAAIEGYGSEIYGFLVGLAKDRTLAGDAFATTCERIWKGLPQFRWTGTLRVWAYQIARNEFLRTIREDSITRGRVPLSQIPSVQLAINHVRSTTPIYEKPAVQDKFVELRASLDPEDHMLLGLRIDREMSWLEIVGVLGTGNPETATREATALRKRFERLKARLVELALDS
ncbi:MAG: RNA polymerase sigma factor [Kofleriaceae bacterium]